MELNLKNIEDLIFFDKDLRDLLHEFRLQFDQWNLAMRIPGLKAHGQRSVLEVLNNLKPEHLKVIEQHVGEPVFTTRTNHLLTAEYNCTTDSHEDLCKFTDYREFSVHRHKDQLSFTFWR